MKNKYPAKSLLFISFSVLLFAIASCKKDNKTVVNNSTVTATPTTLGLYEESDSTIYKYLIIAVSQVGTSTINDGLLFDTGSGGMVIDATSVLPKSMITSSGITFPSSIDSTVVNGIAIYNQKSMIEYGDDNNTTDKVYGYLAYAAVTVGDQNGSVVIKRLPFFLYYKAVDGQGNSLPADYFDTFGVSPEYDITFPNNVSIQSPFSYFNPGTGLTKGFKMAVVDSANFSYNGTYAPVLTLGLTTSDLSSSSGFVMNQLNFMAGDGYAPLIPANITYNGTSFSTQAVFDTGTEPYSYLEDPKFAGNSATLLATSSAVSVATTTGFNYSYSVTPTNNLTYVENPNTSGGQSPTVISLEFFLNNEILIDYTDHKLGLKNN